MTLPTNFKNPDDMNQWLKEQKPIKIHSENEDEIRKPISVEDAFVLKQKGIRQSQDLRQQSMKDFASKRDAALFASSLKSKSELEKDYKYWLSFFEEKYGNNSLEEPF